MIDEGGWRGVSQSIWAKNLASLHFTASPARSKMVICLGLSVGVRWRQMVGYIPINEKEASV